MISRDQLDELLPRWTGGNEDAANFIRAVWEASRDIDDLADGDARDGVLTAYRVVEALLVNIGMNPFYRHNQAALAPTMMVFTLAWSLSDKWRLDENRNVRMTGYVYREAMELIVPVVALLTKGSLGAAGALHDVVSITRANTSETFEDWEKETS